MANSGSIKDIQSIASISALVAVGISSSYFFNEISKIKEQQVEIQKHLASIVPMVNPGVASQMEKAMKAVKLLDSRLAKTQEDIKIMAEMSHHDIPFNREPPPKRVYNRLTKTNKAPAPKGRVTRAVTVTEPIVNDIDDDIAAMS